MKCKDCQYCEITDQDWKYHLAKCGVLNITVGTSCDCLNPERRKQKEESEVKE